LIIWFQGGPGCSGLYGLFNENGPFRIDENNNVVDSKYSWNSIANILYIDQPVGTGFS